MSDVLRIEDLRVDCVVGVWPHERNASQPLHIDIEMRFDTRPAALKESVRGTVDYAAVASQVVFLLRSCRFRLLETAAHTLARYILAPPSPAVKQPQVESVTVRLRKPGALRGFAIPSLQITRFAVDEAPLKTEDKNWGKVDIIHETKDAGIYRLHIAPRKGIPLHIHKVMREAEMVLTEGLFCQRAAVLPGTVHRWPRNAAHVYDNPTDRYQTVLCVDSPRFIPDDEIEVTGEPADVPPEPPWGPVGVPP